MHILLIITFCCFFKEDVTIFNKFCIKCITPRTNLRVAGFVRQVSRFSFTVHVCRLLGCVYNVTVLTFSIQNCFKKCIEIKSLSPTINSHPLPLLSNAHKKLLNIIAPSSTFMWCRFLFAPITSLAFNWETIKVGLTSFLLITVKNINFYWLNNIKRLTTKLNITQWMESQKARLWISSWFSTFTLWLPLFHRKE